MSKFKVGDKVRCNASQFSGDRVVHPGQVCVVTHVDGEHFIAVDNLITNGVPTMYLGAFEIVEEEDKPESLPFDLKTQPWYILVNNEQENKLALEWLFEQGMEWFFGKKVQWYNCKYLTNTRSYNVGVGPHIMHGSDMPVGYEIKLTHKVVTDVQWPTIPVESEKDKAIRELQETIEKAKQQIDELMKH